MDFSVKLFPDLIDALGKVGAGLKAAGDLPRKERKTYRETWKGLCDD